MDIEARRKILETLDVVEASLVARIVKSDRYLPSAINPSSLHPGSHPYSARENAIRRQETALIVDEYIKYKSSWDSEPLKISKGNFETELEALNQLDDEIPASSALSIYELNSSLRGIQRFGCEVTKGNIKEFDMHYPPSESYGETIDLIPTYQSLISKGSLDPETNYRDFLANFREHSKSAGPDLTSYLIEFYNRANFVGTGTGTSAEEQLHNNGIEHDGTLECVPCGKAFSNENVFNAHLRSKKHQKVVERSEPIAPKVTISLPNEALLDLLQPYVDRALETFDRKAGMTMADRELEAATIEKERDEEDQWASENESDENDAQTSKAKPSSVKPLTGPEGRPIPRWLYKLQGLGAIFRCEICGEHTKYSGRKAYERHFQDQMHQMRLKQLGFTPASAFNGVSTLKEASDILKNQRMLATSSAMFEKEVEDDEGNALSERMYEDLKEQGLL